MFWLTGEFWPDFRRGLGAGLALAGAFYLIDLYVFSDLKGGSFDADFWRGYWANFMADRSRLLPVTVAPAFGLYVALTARLALWRLGQEHWFLRIGAFLLTLPAMLVLGVVALGAAGIFAELLWLILSSLTGA